jgi:CO/xanthine dehydrogenase Mo-binding subunit
VFEHRFRTQQVMHTPLEPLVSVAESTENSLTIHTASQSPSFVRIEIARLLGWPENRVRVRVPFLGGGFGAKLYIKLEALVAVLSLLTPRPAHAPAAVVTKPVHHDRTGLALEVRVRRRREHVRVEILRLRELRCVRHCGDVNYPLLARDFGNCLPLRRGEPADKEMNPMARDQLPGQ